jgi:hypothetical protein
VSAKKQAAPAGETMEAMINQIAVDQAAKRERTEQRHLTQRAWQLYGNLIFFGVFEPPDLAVADSLEEEKAMIKMADNVIDIIGASVLSFDNMDIGASGEEF